MVSVFDEAALGPVRFEGTGGNERKPAGFDVFSRIPKVRGLDTKRLSWTNKDVIFQAF